MPLFKMSLSIPKLGFIYCYLYIFRPPTNLGIQVIQVLEAAKARPELLVQVGLEYRYIPAVAELLAKVKQNAVGRVHMVAIREHRFPFLVKVFACIHTVFSCFG